MTTDTRAAIARRLERALRFAIGAVFVAGVRRRNPGAVVNAAVSFGLSFLPGLLERRYGVEFRPWQRVYAVTALFTHAVGMLGPYDDTWWWDHLTHVHSASVLGGLAHAAARRRGRDPRRCTLAAVVVGGVCWEVVEYVIHAVARRLGVEPILVSYGRRDTVLDLFFNAVGALLVLVFGESLLRNLARDDD
ncbi:hypothetical protein [Natrononativus amylolyticus]|uniref:hypothetical protein n=1 Tax=Natrononativus amylolyticus TaxID=2963434 RepID=UPI0020CEE23F|nr:hypothetical protein [Natrononativus amylolyticus]